jgi:hypothetical protein
MPSTVDVISAGAAVVPGGAAVSGVLQIAQSTVRAIGSLFRGSPPVEWAQANSIAMPVATKEVEHLVSSLGAENIQKVFDSYTAKLKAYIKGSPHNPTKTDDFINAVNTEAVGMKGGFRLDAFPFDATNQDQLAWAIWLHCLWLFGGVSQDEVGSGGAMKKFEASLVPTLISAVQEAVGVTIDTSGQQAGTTTTVTTASMFSGTFAKLALVGAAIGLLFFAAKGKV